MSLVIHLHLKAPAHDHSFGTRACRMRCAWIGARAWAGGGAHVAALEGSRVAVYESAVCIVLSGNICIVHEMPARLPGCSVGESTDSRELESRPEMQGFERSVSGHATAPGLGSQSENGNPGLQVRRGWPARAKGMPQTYPYAGWNGLQWSPAGP